MLTLQQLKDMEPHTVFAQGVNLNLVLHSSPIRWVAVRGGIHDWAIYYHTEHSSYDFVRRNGDKVHTKEAITTLVPCDEEAYQQYRH